MIVLKFPVIAFFIFALCVAIPADVRADISKPPTFKAEIIIRKEKKIRHRYVQLSWQFHKSYKKNQPILEIERAAGTTGFLPFVNLVPGRSSGRWTDKSPSPGTSTYRVRLSWTGGSTAWIESHSVTLPDAPTQPPEEPTQPDPELRDCPALNLPEGIAECGAGFATQVFNSVNAERKARQMAPLQFESRLRCSSRIHTVYMIQQKKLTHDNMAQHMAQAHYYYSSAAGQNIAEGYQTPDAVMVGWMNSSGHRDNILRTVFSDIGVSCLKDTSTGRLWWTQDFGG